MWIGGTIGGGELRPPRLRARILFVAAATLAFAWVAPRGATQRVVESPSPTPVAGNPGAGAPWLGGGRFVATQFVDASLVQNRVYADRVPPELTPQLFTFQRVAAGGYQAELDFPAPVVQLHDYLDLVSGDLNDPTAPGSVPVQHTVDLVLTPPSGNPTTVTLRTDGSLVVVRAGTQIAQGTAVILGTRLVMAIPASVPVGADWTVQAVIRLTGTAPLNPRTGLPAQLVAATNPALAGVLDGDTPSAPEPIAAAGLAAAESQRGVEPPDPQALPAGSRPVSVRLEQGPSGLVGVVTLDSPPHPIQTINGQPSNAYDVSLFLAPAVEDGLTAARIELRWECTTYPTNPCPRASSTAELLLTGRYAGTVPVVVSGAELRFDLSHVTPAPTPKAPSPSPASGPILGVGPLTDTLTSDDLVMLPIGRAPLPPPGVMTTITVKGTTISLTRTPGGGTATGTVDPFTGYFFASDDQEMWSGYLGKEGWYAQLLPAAPAAARLDPVPSDINTPAGLRRAIEYCWDLKKRQDPQLARDIGVDREHSWFEQFLMMGRGSINELDPPDSFEQQIKDFFTHHPNEIPRFFPHGLDPVVVPPPPAPPFPFPGGGLLASNGAQWEVGVGMRILDTAGRSGLRMESPYVPAGSIVVPAGSSPAAGAAATPGPASTPGGGSSSLVIAAALGGGAVVIGAALILRRRRRRA